MLTAQERIFLEKFARQHKVMNNPMIKTSTFGMEFENTLKSLLQNLLIFRRKTFFHNVSYNIKGIPHNDFLVFLHIIQICEDCLHNRIVLFTRIVSMHSEAFNINFQCKFWEQYESFNTHYIELTWLLPIGRYLF